MTIWLVYLAYHIEQQIKIIKVELPTYNAIITLRAHHIRNHLSNVYTFRSPPAQCHALIHPMYSF